MDESSSSLALISPTDVIEAPVRVDVPLDLFNGNIVGRRMALFTPSMSWQRDLIAVTEPELDAFNQRTVLLAQEEAWWMWRIAVRTGQPHTERPRNCRHFPTWAVAVENARLLPHG